MSLSQTACERADYRAADAGANPRPRLLGQGRATKATGGSSSDATEYGPRLPTARLPGLWRMRSQAEIMATTKLANKTLPNALPTSTFLFFLAISPRTEGKTLAKWKISSRAMKLLCL